MKIAQMGNEHTNSSSRKGHVPFVIVNHISSSTMSSMDNWFRSSGNEVSSAHFGVSKDGRVHQYVDIKLAAWANGLKAAAIPNAPSIVVKEMKVNPNLYTISIEHEGTDGNLTEAQFTASVWLHGHIQAEVKRIWGKIIKLDARHVIGHCHIDPIRKASCPGPRFPWDRLYQVLKGEEEMLEKVKVDVNGKKVGEGLLVNGITYVPVRVVGEALGAVVDWNEKNKTVKLTPREG
ncbi:N-acetylmuramoyl-L-alanine amidase [Paenibacillus agilis]|uniref:N-acetylmuramoyl-L-alanine amidase n=1 Tax=Paenibacillus agilis TaxID=3020863 RepID=A0A559IZK4_9BACL|nr:N-acetylmuramoyl-L-alanine amidase [Paenibacillus agilis]TVX93059.1 hypothetical protein FPZ44_08290 [Paenibacillus agilis]